MAGISCDRPRLPIKPLSWKPTPSGSGYDAEVFASGRLAIKYVVRHRRSGDWVLYGESGVESAFPTADDAKAEAQLRHCEMVMDLVYGES